MHDRAVRLYSQKKKGAPWVRIRLPLHSAVLIAPRHDHHLSQAGAEGHKRCIGRRGSPCTREKEALRQRITLNKLLFKIRDRILDERISRGVAQALRPPLLLMFAVWRSVAIVLPAARPNLRNAFDFSTGAAEPNMKILAFHSERRCEIFDGKTRSACLLERCQD